MLKHGSDLRPPDSECLASRICAPDLEQVATERFLSTFGPGPLGTPVDGRPNVNLCLDLENPNLPNKEVTGHFS